MERLLYDLVVVHGFAEFDSPEERERLIQDPPPTVDALIEAIILADGRDPALVLKEEVRYLRKVVDRHLGHEIEGSLPAERRGRRRRLRRPHEEPPDVSGI